MLARNAVRWWGVLVLALAASGAQSAARPVRPAVPVLSYLDDGTIRLGVNLEAGGAIAFLGQSGGGTNLVSNWDYGRQIQMSQYSGPVPYQPPGTLIAAPWVGLGWNPVQAGDAFRNPSRLLAWRNDGRTLYVKCEPLQFALDDVSAACTYETWITLQGNVAQVRNRMVVHRADKTQYAARNQELPAVYLVGSLYRLVSYTGDRPFTGGALARIEKNYAATGNGRWPWTVFHATENWAALVNDRNWGVGIWEPGCGLFTGGFTGVPGRGSTHDYAAGYMSPTQTEIIDSNITYEYSYELIVGTLDQIRQHVYSVAPRPTPPVYRFAADRQHWSYKNAVDTGWPIRGELSVRLDQPDPRLVGPAGFWYAADGPRLHLEAAFHTQSKQVAVLWAGADGNYTADRRTTCDIVPDGQYHDYDVDLSRVATYRGAITGVRLAMPGEGHAGDWVKIRVVGLGR